MAVLPTPEAPRKTTLTMSMAGRPGRRLWSGGGGAGGCRRAASWKGWGSAEARLLSRSLSFAFSFSLSLSPAPKALYQTRRDESTVLKQN